jgi:adenine-specific DNA methylase
MKHRLLIASLFAAAFATGCKPSAEKPEGQATETTASQKLDKAAAETKDAAHQAQEYTFEKKDEFVAAMQVQLAELNRGMDELSVKIGKSSEAVKAEAAPKLAALRDQAAQLKKQLGEVTTATASTWGTIKSDSDKTYTDIKNGLLRARQAVADKIAP